MAQERCALGVHRLVEAGLGAQEEAQGGGVEAQLEVGHPRPGLALVEGELALDGRAGAGAVGEGFFLADQGQPVAQDLTNLAGIMGHGGQPITVAGRFIAKRW